MTIYRSARLTHRPNRAEDVAPMHELARDWDVVRMTASWPWPADPAFTASRCGGPFDAARGIVGAVCLGERVIGGMGIHDAGLGYMLGRPYWGNGYATEIGSVLIEAYFDRFADQQSIAAEVIHDNPASMRVLAKLGFERTGPVRLACRARGAEVAGEGFVLTRARHDALRNPA